MLYVGSLGYLTSIERISASSLLMSGVKLPAGCGLVTMATDWQAGSSKITAKRMINGYEGDLRAFMIKFSLSHGLVGDCCHNRRLPKLTRLPVRESLPDHPDSLILNLRLVHPGKTPTTILPMDSHPTCHQYGKDYFHGTFNDIQPINICFK